MGNAEGCTESINPCEQFTLKSFWDNILILSFLGLSNCFYKTSVNNKLFMHLYCMLFEVDFPIVKTKSKSRFKICSNATRYPDAVFLKSKLYLYLKFYRIIFKTSNANFQSFDELKKNYIIYIVTHFTANCHQPESWPQRFTESFNYHNGLCVFRILTHSLITLSLSNMHIKTQKRTQLQ